VGVAVDEPGRDHVPLGVELLAPRPVDLTDRRDPAVGDANVGPGPERACAVDHRAVADHQVEVHDLPPASVGRSGGLRRRPW
jgi:hypothetical protein